MFTINLQQLVRVLAGSLRVRFPMGHFKFSLTESFGRLMALKSTQSLLEMSTRNITWGVKATGAYG
jgi:hypothetical protein